MQSVSLLLILGTATLAMALRSYRHPVLQKLGAMCVLLTSFLIGWILLGSILAGVLCAASWFMLPWVELLTRIRGMRLPSEKSLRPRSAPSRERFPFLDSLTDEVTAEGFVQIADVGWDWEEYQQFFRLFYRETDKAVASICFVEQSELAFYYLSVSSRESEERNWTTWNYPFSNSLKLIPGLRVKRVGADSTFAEICRIHLELLMKNRVDSDCLMALNEETILTEIQKDLSAQIRYNLSKGILSEAGEGMIRYSWRGLIFLWLQTIRDLVRLS